MKSGHLRTLVVATALLSAACGGGTSSGHAGATILPPTAAVPTVTVTSTAATTTGVAGTVSLSTLRAVALRPADLPAGYSGNVMVQGDLVTGQVTLDMCGFTFASEALRTARHQVSFQTSNKAAFSVSNEVVAYSGSGATTALAEVRYAAAHCPRGVVASKESGVPDTVQRVTVLPGSAALPRTSIRLAVTATDPKTGRQLAEEAIFTVRGHVLSGVYVIGLGSAAAAEALHVATIVEHRLAKLVPAK